MNREAILNYLISVKEVYQKEGFLIKALFGSYSRDEANAHSDVDILVEATPEFANRYGQESSIQIFISLELNIQIKWQKNKRWFKFQNVTFFKFNCPILEFV